MRTVRVYDLIGQEFEPYASHLCYDEWVYTREIWTTYDPTVNIYRLRSTIQKR